MHGYCKTLTRTALHVPSSSSEPPPFRIPGPILSERLQGFRGLELKGGQDIDKNRIQVSGHPQVINFQSAYGSAKVRPIRGVALN